MRDQLFARVFPFALRVARFRAAVIVAVLGLRPSDKEDFVQDVLFHAWLQLAAFDPTRSSLRTFCNRVIQNKAASIIEKHVAQKRDCRRCRASLDEQCDVDHSAGTKSSPVDVWTDTSLYTFDNLELGIDVERVIARMPSELRHLARSLMLENSTEISRTLGLSRATVYRRIRQIREHFTEAGLQKYVSGNERRRSANHTRVAA
jgi:RNA polymerase sigma factor (sigma-70 family)